MAKLLRFVVISACAVIVLGSSVMADKLTVDPNTPQGRAASGLDQKADKGDFRLAGKVTYSATMQPLSKILVDLSEQSGVTLNAGFNDSDWQVRDRRMNVFVKDIPLVDLMNSIAATMKFGWKKQGEEKKWTYRLIMNRAAVIPIESAKQKLADKVEQKAAQTREELANEIDRLAGLSDSEIEALKSQNPYLYALGASGTARGLNSFFGECPDARAAFVNGTSWSAKASKLPKSAQDALIATLFPMLKLQTYTPGIKPKGMSDYSASLDEIEVNFRAGSIANGQAAWIGYSFPNEDIAPDGSKYTWGYSADIGFRDPNSATAKAEGEQLIDMWAKRQDHPDDQQSLSQDEQEWSQKVSKVWETEKPQYAFDSKEPIAKHPDDPDLAKEVLIKLEPKKKYGLVDIEQILFAEFGMNVIADAYSWETGATEFIGHDTLSLNATHPESSLQSVLDMVQNYQSNWWKNGSAIEIRDRDWYRQRTRQVPEAWLEYWRDVYTTKTILDIDDLAPMCRLSDEQIQKNIIRDDVLTNRLYDQSPINDITVRTTAGILLKFYATLTESQKSKIFTQDGLELLGMRPRNEKNLETILYSAASPSSYLNPKSGAKSVWLVGTRTPAKDGMAYYSFTIKADTTAGIEQREFANFTTPKYVKPKEEAKKDNARS